MGKKKMTITLERKQGQLMPVPKPNKVHKDKTKYTRKVKHREVDND